MAGMENRYAKEEFARRGDAIYESAVRPQLKPEDEGKFVAIDIDSDAFEIDADELTACRRLRAYRPHARIWLVRAAWGYLHRFGRRELRGRQ